MTAASERYSVRTLVRTLIAGRKARILALSATALLSALAEAVVLVAITQVAFTLAKSGDAVVFKLGPVSFEWPIRISIAVTFGLVLLRGAFQVVNGWQSTTLVTGYLAEARKEFTSAFLHSSVNAQTKGRGGELQELLTGFVGRGASSVDTLTKGITAIWSLVALLGTAIAVSPLASIGMLAAVGLLGLTILPLRRVIGGSSRRAADADMAFATSVNEYGGLGREMQVFGVEDEIGDRLDTVIDENAHASKRLQFLSFLFTPLYATVLMLVLVLGLAAVRVMGITNLASLGAVMLVMIRSLAYAQLAQGVYASLHASAPYMSDLHDRLTHLQAEAVSRPGQPMKSFERLDVQDVGFEYIEGEPALSEVSFTLRHGEIIGIVGPSGSGKSTLVQLLLRLRTPTTGVIGADGVDISAISLDDWRTMTAFVPQESRLIHGTVSENIRFFRPGYTDADVLRAAGTAQIRAEIEALPNGFDHLIGDASHAMSGGQRQRICIARALLSRPRVLIMDEPTSALDVHSESRIRDAVNAMRGDTTVVIIAHRLSTLDACDRIMVIQDGHLRAFDTPDRLRDSDAFYREALTLSGLR